MFSQTTEYALRAMAWLSVLDSGLVSTNTLADRTEVPANYLSKVLQQLAAGRLVVGQRGAQGGYKLARPAAEITLLDIARCMAPVERITRCPLAGRKPHNGSLCPLHTATDRAAAAVIDVLGSVTLVDLKRDPHPLCEGCGRRG